MSINVILLSINVGFFILLFRSALRIRRRKQPVNLSILPETISFWKDRLSDGDILSFSPINHKNTEGLGESFLQFKISEEAGVKFVDLVYPVVLNDNNTDEHEEEMSLLSTFFKMKSVLFYDDANDLNYYFIEVDTKIPNHMLFLLAVAMRLRGFELDTIIDFKIIYSDSDFGDKRYAI